MGTPSKQIGWSTEANLLHAILRQLDQLAGVIAVSGGGGLGNFVTLDTVQPIVARKDFSVVAGPAATFTSSTGNTVNVTATTGSGVYSTSVDGPGIEGFSVNDPGIFGYSSNEPGVFSHSANSVGFIVDSLNVANLSDLAHFRANGTPVVKIAKNGNTTIDGFITGTITRVLPSGNTSIGQIINLTQTDPTSRFINRLVVQHNEDGIASTLTNTGVFEVTQANLKSTSQPSTTHITAQFNFNQQGSGTLGSALGVISKLAGVGTGAITTVTNFEASVLSTNPYPITNYHGFNLLGAPQNNVTNAYGVKILNLYGTVISRAFDSAVSAGVGQYNIYAQGTAQNYFNGNIGAGVTVPTAKVHIAASTTLVAAMRLTVGVAPTTPNDGDMWLESNTLTGLKIRIGGVTRTVTLT